MTEATLELFGPKPEDRIAMATATERVQERQLRLLFTQREIINDQIEEATRKRDDATRDILAAEAALKPEPVVVDLLQPEHRPYAWRGNTGEVWTWHEDRKLFLWTYDHPAAGFDPDWATGHRVGKPFTCIGLVGDMADSGQDAPRPIQDECQSTNAPATTADTASSA